MVSDKETITAVSEEIVEEEPCADGPLHGAADKLILVRLDKVYIDTIAHGWRFEGVFAMRHDFEQMIRLGERKAFLAGRTSQFQVEASRQVNICDLHYEPCIQRIIKALYGVDQVSNRVRRHDFFHTSDMGWDTVRDVFHLRPQSAQTPRQWKTEPALGASIFVPQSRST